MSVFSMFDKLDDLIYAPIKLITDWAGEPLKKWEHERALEQQKQEKELEHSFQLMREREKLELDIRREAEKANIDIKRETEVARILMEVEQLKKDREFDRMNAVSEAVMKYQRDLMKLNTDAINAVGRMSLALREQAQGMVYQKTIQYKELQDKALKEAMTRLEEIEEKFGNNEAVKNMLIKNVDLMLSNVINTAHNFLIGLNDDIKALNASIDLLAESAQKSVEKHLEQFRGLAISAEGMQELKQSDMKMLN